jgi:hypothetical protein
MVGEGEKGSIIVGDSVTVFGLYRAICISITYRMVSLFAKKSLFVLIQKVTKKIKTTSMLPSLPAGSLRFFRCSVLRTSHHTKS